MGTKAILAKIENQAFDLGEQGKEAIYFRGTREHVPPWEGFRFQILSEIPIWFHVSFKPDCFFFIIAKKTDSVLHLRGMIIS